MRTMFQWTHEMLTHVPCGLKMDDKTCIDKTNDQLSCFSPVPNCLAVPAVCSVSVCTLGPFAVMIAGDHQLW